MLKALQRFNRILTGVNALLFGNTLFFALWTICSVAFYQLPRLPASSSDTPDTFSPLFESIIGKAPTQTSIESLNWEGRILLWQIIGVILMFLLGLAYACIQLRIINKDKDRIPNAADFKSFVIRYVRVTLGISFLLTFACIAIFLWLRFTKPLSIPNQAILDAVSKREDTLLYAIDVVFNILWIPFVFHAAYTLLHQFHLLKKQESVASPTQALPALADDFA
ncbi:MAG: hypothetical protein ABI615_13670 [Chthoniobacterales bacterium]